MTVENGEAEFGEWSPPAADGPWKEPMYREKAKPVGTTEMPTVILGRNDGIAGKRRSSRSMRIYIYIHTYIF